MSHLQRGLAKALAATGRWSRREANRMTADARVCVNGVQVSNPAARVRQSDRVTVDGELTPLEVAPPRLWRFHKPDGLITTASDPQGRPTERGVTGAMLRAMGDGFGAARAVRTPLQPAAAGHEWVRMTLVEGKTREVRRAWQHFGFVVSRREAEMQREKGLVRDAYGPFELGELRPGEVEEVPRRCVARLLRLRERVLEGSGRAAPVDLAAFCENEQT
ncbi:hypothetical protein EMIHUDRAFT_115100 [Emiliania huxleyi CCMP1516]|uniref:RNA-binding S4 domain-containing protein n=2 Tax=Emiliania huxleyi TaxID=2903 RepID=A0A0D3JRV4_EMIH1|nr:hypothetical protein EMIHUDRAFT_115100 [Emiliania huxleyi CCMP1516]EOD26239.1 hypothetical protein EMIHUDRAFT_115100 [Emiliania huxleyi CCMP1516]|eukprot:XP_005778668.1 hypothetical protein EMIHUDRAFT_115100 [Emiliania huxleyi CCMP1516]